MSAGDSITAGLGARWSYTRPTLFVYEDCGVSFATGGDEDVVSVVKLVEAKWGTVVAGKSYGSRRVNLCIDRPANSKIKEDFPCFYVHLGVFCPRDPIRLRRKEDGYNVAMTGSTSEALPLQYAELIKRLEEDGQLRGPKGGKVLLTLLIGANDLCMWDCRRPEQQYDSFRSHLNQFVNDVTRYFGETVKMDLLIAEIPALEGVPSRAEGTLMEGFAVLECPCAYYKSSNYSFPDRIAKYNQVIRSLSYRPSILITRVLREEALKLWPKEMTSKLDAFHPSKWAHEYFAEKIFAELEDETKG